MLNNLEHKTILLIGGTGAFAKALLESKSDYNFLVVTRTPPVASVRSNITYIRNTNPSEVIKNIELHMSQRSTITSIIYNATVRNLKLLHDTVYEELQEEILVGLTLPILYSNTMVKLWDTYSVPGGKNIIYITSMAGLTNYYNQGYATYSCLKSSLHTLIQHQSAELSERSINVYGVAPWRYAESDILQQTIEVTLNCLADGYPTGSIIPVAGTD